MLKLKYKVKMLFIIDNKKYRLKGTNNHMYRYRPRKTKIIKEINEHYQSN